MVYASFVTALGVVYLVGRIIFTVGYRKSAVSRMMGARIQFPTTFVIIATSLTACYQMVSKVSAL